MSTFRTFSIVLSFVFGLVVSACGMDIAQGPISLNSSRSSTPVMRDMNLDEGQEGVVKSLVEDVIRDVLQVYALCTDNNTPTNPANQLMLITYFQCYAAQDGCVLSRELLGFGELLMIASDDQKLKIKESLQEEVWNLWKDDIIVNNPDQQPNKVGIFALIWGLFIEQLLSPSDASDTSSEPAE